MNIQKSAIFALKLLQKSSNLDMILLQNNIIFGVKILQICILSIAEQFIGLELLKSASCYMPENLFFWTREKPQSNAEVDYVVQQGEKIIPIEVKSGTTGKMQSLHLFMNEKKSEFGVRTSLENFAQYDKIKVFPLYAIGNLGKSKIV